MKIFIRNGFIVAEWEGKPTNPFSTQCDYERSMSEEENKFITALRWDADEDLGNPYVDLRMGTVKLSFKPYTAFTWLEWINRKAMSFDSIELDESFMALFEKLLAEYTEIYDRCKEEHEATQTAKAIVDFEKINKSTKTCEGCLKCVGVIDGDLYCAKYKKDLEVEVGEKYDYLNGRYYMFASSGIPLPECLEDEKKDAEKEKEKMIEEYCYGYGWWAIEDAVAKEMNKGEVSYG